MKKPTWRSALVLAVGGLTASMLSVPAATAAESQAAPTQQAERQYAPDTVIVKFKPGASRAERSTVEGLAGVLDTVAPIRGTDAVTLRIAGDPQSAVEQLNQSSAVEYAELNSIVTTQAMPDDPEFDQLYGLHNTGQDGGTEDADIDAPEGWQAAGLDDFPATGGAKVGIVDTGIATEHPEFAGDKIVDCGGVNDFGLNLIIIIIGADPTIVDDPAKCEDDNGHGTHVAGTIGATADNGEGVAGVAFNSPLSVCKGLNQDGSGTLDMVANCITWLSEKDADVISMSLGATSGAEVLEDAISNAYENGSLLVAASGNGGDSTPNYPAAYDDVVSVGATDRNDEIAEFSTHNDSVEVSAPGVDVLSTWLENGNETASGTSMATPHAAGVAAMIAGQNPDGSVEDWRGKLGDSVDDLGEPGRDEFFGFGRVNLHNAVS